MEIHWERKPTTLDLWCLLLFLISLSQLNKNIPPHTITNKLNNVESDATAWRQCLSRLITRHSMYWAERWLAKLTSHSLPTYSPARPPLIPACCLQVRLWMGGATKHTRPLICRHIWTANQWHLLVPPQQVGRNVLFTDTLLQMTKQKLTSKVSVLPFL